MSRTSRNVSRRRDRRAERRRSGISCERTRTFEVPPDNWETKKVAIIGGGIAGLTAAWKLKKENFNDFVLLELEKEIGGTSQSGTGEPVGYPWGAHYLPVPFQENTELIALLDEMSLIEGRDADGEVIVKEQFLCREPEERVFYKGRWYEGLYLQRRRERRGQAAVCRVSKADRHLGKLARRDRADAHLSCRSRIVRTMPKSRRSIRSHLPIGCGRTVLHPSGSLVLRLRVPRRLRFEARSDIGVGRAVLFLLARPKKRRRVAAVYHFPEGNGRFVNHFFEKVKDNVRRSQMVVSIVPTEKGVDVICLDGGNVRGFHCEKVIFASPIFTAPYVIRGFREDAVSRRTSFSTTRGSSRIFS